MERTEIITRTEDPVELLALIHLDVLTDSVAPPEVMREQLAHLFRMGELSNVTIQLVPTVRGWISPSLAGSFILIEPNDDVATPIVHIEHYRGGAFIWEMDDVRSYAAAAKEIAQKAMTPARTAEVIAEMEKST